MRRIDRNSKILCSNEYKKDRNQFHIIELNLPSRDLVLYSDEENYLICRGQLGRPVWVWTVDGINKNKMNEVAELITEQYLTEVTECKLTAKREFYTFLKEVGYPYLNDDYFEMGRWNVVK